MIAFGVDVDSTTSLVLRPVSIPTFEEDVQLIQKAQQGSVEARNELIERHMPFVVKIAKEHFAFRRPYHLELDDLIQACVFGMDRAISKYDYEKSRGRFIGYAKHWIRHFMDTEIHFTKAYRIPSSVEFAYKKGKVKTKKTRDAVERFQEMVPLAEDYDTEDHRDAADSLETKERLELLRRALGKLPESSCRLMFERYIEGKTLKEIGKGLGVCRERVRQLLDEVEAFLVEECKDYT